MTKITVLPPDAAPTLTDYIPTVDNEAVPVTTKKTLLSALLTLFAANAPASTARLTGECVPYAGRTAPSGWALMDGSAISRASFSALAAVIMPSLGTFTVTIAAPAIVTQSNHGLQTGDQVFLTTTGALPTGLVANTLYYAVRIDANTFNLSTTRANAYAGTKITTTGTQSGTHTVTYCPYGLGDGSTTFNVPDGRGRTLAGNDYMGGTAASRLTGADALGAYGNQGASGGEQRHTMTTAELATHKHGVNGSTGNRLYSPDFNNGTAAGAGASVWGSATPDNAGSSTPFNLISPTLVANYIIKT